MAHHLCSAAILAAAISAVSFTARADDKIEAKPVAATDAPESAAPPADQKRIGELIAQLGADDFFVREKAQDELIAAGKEAFDALSETLDGARDIEIIERADYMLRLIRIDWADKGDPLEIRNLLQNYEGMDEDNRRATVDKLAAMTDPRALATLCRVVRFERSQAVSKHAAVKIIEQKAETHPPGAAREAVLREGIGDSPRAAAHWLRAYSLANRDKATGLAEFAKLTDTEALVLRQYPQRSRPEIVMSLWRYQADLLESLGNHKQAVEALFNMVALEQSGTAALIDVLDRLVAGEHWADVDELAERFGLRFEQDALSTYSLADARRKQGKSTEAAALAALARRMDVEDQRQHILTGWELHKRGLILWSEDEYRTAIDLGAPGQDLTVTAQSMLSESLHDRQQDLEAAQVREAAVKGMEAVQGRENGAGSTIASFSARAHYFRALHHERQGESEDAQRHLLDGLGEDQNDTEILIALHQLPELDRTIRDRVRKLIRETADKYREEIRNDPEDDTAYNQLAWLISNTEGDFQEALRASQKSIDLVPDTPDRRSTRAGHMDTLARCHYALGDYESAVKVQKAAIEMEPHAEQMKRQLAVFEAALAKHGGK